MTALKLGIDLDNVVADFTSAVVRAARSAGLAVGPHDPNTWGFTGPGWFSDREEAEPLVLAAHAHLSELPVLDPTAAPALQSLIDAGHRVVIVTARPAVFEAVTHAWLHRHRIPHHDLVHTADKSSVAADAYLDDSPRVVRELREAGHAAVVLGHAYNLRVAWPRVQSVAQFAECVGVRTEREASR